MIADEVAEALRKAIAPGRPDPFVTYVGFARTHGFSDKYPPAWANGPTLNAVADTLKRNSAIIHIRTSAHHRRFFGDTISS
jgi:hypothetical protein